MHQPQPTSTGLARFIPGLALIKAFGPALLARVARLGFITDLLSKPVLVGPTAGLFLIDITAGKSAKQIIRGEWFVGTAVLTSVTYLIAAKYFGLTIYPATLIAFLVGFSFRVAALWFAWEEPLPRGVPEHVRGEVVPRESLKEKMRLDWEPKYD